VVERILTFGSRRPLAGFLILVLLTVLSAGGLFGLRVDTSYDSLISRNDPGIEAYERAMEAFGSDNTTVVYVRDDDLFTQAKLSSLEELVFGLEGLDAVERIDSLFSVKNIRDRDGVLDSGLLMDHVPETAAGIARVRANALDNPLIRGNLISKDGKASAINVTVRRDRADPAFNRVLFGQIEETLAPFRGEFERLLQVGPPRLNVAIEHALFADLRTLTPISTLVLVVTLFLFLRTPFAPAIPLVTAGISIVWTLGFMGYAGLPVTLLTAIVPSLVIVLGSTEDTHMLAAYLHGIEKDPRRDRRRAVRFLARSVGLPIFITSLTTAAGFFSNAVNDVPLIREFAYAASFSMVANLLATILALPLLLSLVGPRKGRIGREEEMPPGPIGAIVRWLIRIGRAYDKPILAGSVVLLVVFGAFAARVYVSNDPFTYLRADNPMMRDVRTVERDFPGLQVFYLTLEAGETGAFRRSENLRTIQAIERFLGEQGAWDKTISLADLLALVNREVHGSDPAFFRVPDSNDLVGQYLLLFQRDDIDRYVSGDFRRANIIVRHHLSDSHTLNGKLTELRGQLEGVLDKGMTYELVGENLMINRAAESLFLGQVQALLLLVAVIFAIMSFLFTSATAGFLSLIPNAIPVVLAFGTMGLLGIPLNPGTATVAAIAVGLAVDNTVHILIRYNTESRSIREPEDAVLATLRTQAVPVISTSVALAAGFAILMFSEFRIVAQFGLLAAATMAFAMLANLLVTPLLMKRIRLVGVWEIVALEVGRKVLFESPLFRNMTPYQIRKAILLAHMEQRIAGEEVTVQGERGRSMYLLLSGSADVLRREGEHEEWLATLGAGEVFGEIGYLGEAERIATVRTREDSRLLRFDVEAMERALRFYPGIAARLNRNIIRILGHRLEEADRRLVESGGS
jgi:predicted RND superfamily exporter protein